MVTPVPGLVSIQARQTFLYGGPGARFDVFAAPRMKPGEYLIGMGKRCDAIGIDGDFVARNGPDRHLVAQTVEISASATTTEG